jgi:hypothetical protein
MNEAAVLAKESGYFKDIPNHFVRMFMISILEIPGKPSSIL